MIYKAMEEEIQMHIENASDNIGKVYPGHESTLRDVYGRRAEGFKKMLHL
jgi:hypothetical protein